MVYSNIINDESAWRKSKHFDSGFKPKSTAVDHFSLVTVSDVSLH